MNAEFAKCRQLHAVCLAAAFVASMLLASASYAEEPEQTSTQQKSVDLTIRISNVKHSEGELVIVVYGAAADFPDKVENANYTFRIKPAKPEVTIKSIPPGDYAVVVTHDVNNNKIVDKTFIGIPTEPVGVSNYEMIGVRNRPTFEKARVKVTQSGTIIVKLNSVGF